MGVTEVFFLHHFQEILGIVHWPVQATPSPFSGRNCQVLWSRLSVVIRMEFLENFQGLLFPSVALNTGRREKLSFGICQLCLVQDYWPSPPACGLFQLCCPDSRGCSVSKHMIKLDVVEPLG